MPVFATLYQFAHNLLVADRNSELGRLSVHSGMSADAAHQVLQNAILQGTIPGEDPHTPWGVTRVFMRNLVNRAFPPISSQRLVEMLDSVEAQAPNAGFDERVQLLLARVAHIGALSQSLGAFLHLQPAPGIQYCDWLRQRIDFYADQTTAQVNVEQVIADVRVLASDPTTRVPHMRTPLAANLLADLGIRAFVKPDRHVLPTAAVLAGFQTVTEEDCIRIVVQVAKNEADNVQQNAGFGWMPNGLHPRHLDRLIYLIGSDNFQLNGTQNRRHAGTRRLRMFAALDGFQQGQAPAQVPIADAPELPPAPLAENEQPHDHANAEILFFNAIEDHEVAGAIVHDVLNLAAEQGVLVHFTRTDDADLRIRASRHAPHPRQQNVVTMRWKPRLGHFTCQVYAPMDACIGAGIPAADVKANYAQAPLPTLLRAHQGNADALGAVVALSIGLYRGD